jgi:hypothetical protein
MITMITTRSTRSIAKTTFEVIAHRETPMYNIIGKLFQFLDALAEANDFAEVISIGQSYEGRDMKVLAVTKVPSQAI